VTSVVDLTSSMNAHWKLDEGLYLSDTFSLAREEVSSYDGRLMNGALWLANSDDSNGVADLDGLDDYVRIGTRNRTGINWSGDMSASMWINPRSVNGYKYVFSRGLHSSADGIVIRFLGNMMFAGGQGTWAKASTRQTLGMVDKWSHICLTFNSSDSSWTLYIDGQQVDQAIGGSGSVENSKPYTIGALQQGDGQYFDGMIDNVRLYTTALSADAITKLSQEEPGEVLSGIN